MLSIGLTGGIASGKSSALNYFKKLGAYTIDADAIAHQCLDIGHEGYRRVVTAFGQDVLHPDTSIDRQKLGSLIFSDPAQRRRLNELLHPLIIAKLRTELNAYHGKKTNVPLIADVPLLFECGLEEDFDAIIVVVAPPEVQKRRLMERNNLSPQAAEQRLAAQMPLSEKAHRADYVIDNSGTTEQLAQEVQRVYELLLQQGAGMTG